MIRILFICLVVTAGPAWSERSLVSIIEATDQHFAGLPPVVFVDDIAEVCGGGAEGVGVYCPSERRIYLAADAELSRASYVLAHLYGHAMQVTYGVADIALAAIRADRPREPELRGMVTRQVECLAGVVLARAGHDLPDLDALFDQEPMTGSHWGANPVRNGPRVSIGTEARVDWLSRGYAAGQPQVCNVGEMSASLVAENFTE